jgi:hypothetical protein
MGRRTDVEPVPSEHFCCAIRPVLAILPEAADRICEDGVEVPSSSLVLRRFSRVVRAKILPPLAEEAEAGSVAKRDYRMFEFRRDLFQKINPLTRTSLMAKRQIAMPDRN